MSQLHQKGVRDMTFVLAFAVVAVGAFVLLAVTVVDSDD